MTTLARWLDNHRTTLLPRWLALVEGLRQGGNGDGKGVLVHPGERAVLLGSLYDSLISAADGCATPLEECLRVMRALRSTPGEEELCDQIGAVHQLRRVAWDLLLDERAGLAGTRPLLEELESLLDRAMLMLVSYWTDSARVVSQQLRQTELLATSLHDATEQADRVALQLSNLNEIGRALASRLDEQYLFDVVGGRLVAMLGVAQALLCVADSGGELSIARIWGEPPGCVSDYQLGGDGDLLRRAFASRETILDGAPAPAAQGSWYREGCGVMAVPVIAQEHVIGVIALQDTSLAIRLDQGRQRFISSVVSQAAIAIENARLYQEVRSFNAVLEARIAERTRELQSERDTLETLHQIGMEISSTLDLDMLLQNCLDMLANLVGVSHGSVMLIDRETDQLVDRAKLGEGKSRGHPRFQVGIGIAGWVAQQKKPALIDDVCADARWLSIPSDEAGEHKTGGSMIAVPLVAHHDVMGVLTLSHHATGYFTEAHLRLLMASTGVIALGVYNAMLYDQIQQELMRQGERLRNERRAAAQSYAILQSLSDGVIVCSAEGSVMAANPAASDILDCPVEELLTWHLPDLFGRLLGQRSAEIPIEELLARPHDPLGNPRHFKTTFRIGTREISLSLDPVTASNEEILGAVAVFRDITREVESDRLKDEFIGTVSHELRTPMTSIKGYTQLMAMGSLGPLTDTQREFLQTIHTNAERMISVINDLLDITKIETGSVRSELDIRPLHMAEALSYVVVDLQPRIQAREQELSISIPPGLPMVRVDARRFNQILYNLATNAIKYTPCRGRIAIEAREISEMDVPAALRDGLRPGRYVQIDVRDSGIGIAAEEHERIFERFYRTENPLKIEAGGTGLGLALVKPLIKLFGGRIWLESAPNEGSTFSFVIPATV